MSPNKPISHAFSCRPFSADDLPSILKIESLSYPEPWTEKHFSEETARPYSRFVVLTDDETDSIIIGYMIYWLQAECVSLLNITVNPDWRGLGMSKKLMQVMIKEAVREDIPKVVLEVRESNKGAIALYESVGFKRTHIRPKFYSDGEAAIVMEIKTSEFNLPLQ